MLDQMQCIMIPSAQFFQKVSDKARAEQSCAGQM